MEMLNDFICDQKEKCSNDLSCIGCYPQEEKSKVVFDPETFSKQFKKHYDYIIKEEGEMWDNIYPMSDWTLGDHILLWKFVDRKMLVFDISIGGFVLTDWYIEQEKEDE